MINKKDLEVELEDWEQVTEETLKELSDGKGDDDE